LLDGTQIPNDAEVHYRWADALIQRASLLDIFRERGYSIETIPSAFDSVALRSADTQINEGRLTELEVRLMAVSPWTYLFQAQIAEFIAANQRGHVVETLQDVASLAEASLDRPMLLFAHIHSPHTPFVLHPYGTEPVPMPDCLPIQCLPWNATIEELDMSFDEFHNGLELQVAELNRLILDAMRRIVDSDPDAMVILMSDHGIRYSLEDLDEHYRIFLAARTADGSSLLAADDSPINVFRRVLASMGEPIEPLAYEKWASNWSRPLDMTRLADGE
jgi:hypothetical protein